MVEFTKIELVGEDAEAFTLLQKGELTTDSIPGIVKFLHKDVLAIEAAETAEDVDLSLIRLKWHILASKITEQLPSKDMMNAFISEFIANDPDKMRALLILNRILIPILFDEDRDDAELKEVSPEEGEAMMAGIEAKNATLH